MTDQRLPLDAFQAVAFRRAFDERNEYIHRERLHLRIGGEDSVPLPGCPECSVPAEQSSWAIYESSGFGEDADCLETDVEPCGHRFTTPLPLPDQITLNQDGEILSVKPLLFP